jgi:4-hydroxythreonine-4-phosphate dehydrogenase
LRQKYSPNKLAITMGDPRGVGPEIIGQIAPVLLTQYPDIDFICLGPQGFDPGIGEFVSVGVFEGTEASAGATSALSIEKASALALEGTVGGIVTGPIHKPALQAAGWKDLDHTSMLARITGSPDVGMLMNAEDSLSGHPLRVLLATTHIPFRSIASKLHTHLLVSQAKLLHQGLSTFWNMESPKIALCGLNPHASDSGLFGDEEQTIFRPAIHELSDMGLNISGPLPADTVFIRALKGDFDAVIAPYHDVGMAAFKTATFGKGVNVTLGLPFIRTSPDHGTAFDIVGTGEVNTSSMLEAIQLAVRMSKNVFDTASHQA